MICLLPAVLAIQPLSLAAQPQASQPQTSQSQTSQPQTNQPQPVETVVAPAPLKARYAWGYSGMDGQGKGTLSLFLDPSTGRVILELHGLAERLVFLTGNRAEGYSIQIPRRDLDLKNVPFEELPLPFLPQIGQVENLYKLLTEGEGPGVKVTRRDGKGPVKLQYSGTDERGKDVMVWLRRTRWEPVTTDPN